jgi:hypothetical protein
VLQPPISHSAFEDISRFPGVRLISLQENEGSEQIDEWRNAMRVELNASEINDGHDAFVDSAAIIANLNFVITSDSAMAHLARALGRPVWLVLQHVPDWRWQLDRSDSPPVSPLFRMDRFTKYLEIA